MFDRPSRTTSRTVLIPLFLAGAFVLGACGTGKNGAQGPETVVVVSEVTAAPTSPPETAAPPPQTVVVVEQPPRTVVQVVEVPPPAGVNPVSIPPNVQPGNYCKWLRANGYSAAEALATYVALGRPDHMDADRNGIPCETVY